MEIWRFEQNSILSSNEHAFMPRTRVYLFIFISHVVTASSSELSDVGATFLQLSLQLDRGGGVKQDVHMEMSLPQFYRFLHEMEKVNTLLDSLS